MTKQDVRAAKPFVKWAGGKRQLLDELIARVPKGFGTYHEPFVGGGALFFRLKALGWVREACLSDANPELINAYVMLRDQLEAVIAELEGLSSRLSEDDYYAIRAEDPATLTEARRAARLIYLNRMGFNGLYRVNSKGKFNVPYGRYVNPTVLDRENLLAVSNALKGVRIEAASFDAVLERARPGDFVYFDPPYQPVSATSHFTAYAKGGFGETDQRHLAEVVCELAKSGVEVLLSNSDTPFALSLYQRSDLIVSRVSAIRAINSKASGRGAVGELLVQAHARSLHPKTRPSSSQVSIAFASEDAVPFSGVVGLCAGTSGQEAARSPSRRAKCEV